MQRHLNHSLLKRRRYPPGTEISPYGTHVWTLDSTTPCVHWALTLPPSENSDKQYTHQTKKRRLFQTLHALRDSNHSKTSKHAVANLLAYPSSYYVLGTYRYTPLDEPPLFVHFELTVCGDDSIHTHTTLIHQWMQREPRVKHFLQLILLWSETVPLSSTSTTLLRRMGPYEYMTLAIHYLHWTGFMETTARRCPLSATALLFGFFHFYAHYPWATRTIGLGMGWEHDHDNGIQNIQDFTNASTYHQYEVSLLQESIQENYAYWQSFVLKRDPNQTDHLWLAKPMYSV